MTYAKGNSEFYFPETLSVEHMEHWDRGETKRSVSVQPVIKVSVYPKFDHFSKKLIFAFSDRSYCNLSCKKILRKKIDSKQSY